MPFESDFAQLFSRADEWIMSGYTTITTFFDESGKFKDHDVVCFGGVASYGEDINRFADEWGRLLASNGLKEISGKTAFNHRHPFGSRNSAVGVRKRTIALRPFIQCIRNNLLSVTGVTVDVPTFKKLPSHFYQFYGNDPVFMAFARGLLHLLEFTPENDKISFICDDEEQMALPFYHLYRKIRKVWPPAKKKLVGISFVDDSVLFGLQAADLVSGLMRLEAGRLWFKKQYDYRTLFKQLTKTPSMKGGERIWRCDIAFGGKKSLLAIAE